MKALKHTYTVSEINELRDICSSEYQLGPGPHLSGLHGPALSLTGDAATAVEQRVQTLMKAGIRAKDIQQDWLRKARAIQRECFSDQMRMAREVCEYFAHTITRKSVWVIYRRYKECIYGRNLTPYVDESGFVRGAVYDPLEIMIENAKEWEEHTNRNALNSEKPGSCGRIYTSLCPQDSMAIVALFLTVVLVAAALIISAA